MKTILRKYIIKTWDELTEDEKEVEKEKYCEVISRDWADISYEDFKYGLEDIKDRYKNIKFDDVIIEDYYIDSEKLEKIKATKKYEKWVNEIVKDVNNWIDEINEVCENYIKGWNDVPDDFVEEFFTNRESGFEYYVNTVEEDEVIK